MSLEAQIAIGGLLLFFGALIGVAFAHGFRRVAPQPDQRSKAHPFQCATCGVLSRTEAMHLAHACPQAAMIAKYGACGVRGCRNQKPHSHVVDLCRRIQGK